MRSFIIFTSHLILGWWAGNLVRLGEMCIECKTLVGKKRNVRHLEHLVLDEVVILKWILRRAWICGLRPESRLIHFIPSHNVPNSYCNIILFSCCLIISGYWRTKSDTHFPFLHMSRKSNTSLGLYSDVYTGLVILGRHTGSSPAAHPTTQRRVPEEPNFCPRCDHLSDRKWVCNDSRNTTIFGKIPKNIYRFRPLIEWDIIRLKQENNRENHTR
jgi:hypothetical protein